MRKISKAIFDAGIRAVMPEVCVARHLNLSDGRLWIGGIDLDLDQIRHIYVAGAGKASGAMAREVEQILGSRIHDGLVITKYGHGLPLKHCRVLEAGHPVPDSAGVAGASALLDMVSEAGKDDLIVCLISGGASALTPAPADGLSLADKQDTTRQLLGCGATIHEINTIRKHLSTIKGGQLCAAANGARVVSLILSDVIGDDLDIIGSGMTAPDTGHFRECRAILERHGIWDSVPEPVRSHIRSGMDGLIPDTPKPGDPIFSRVTNQVVGSLSDALSAAAIEAENQGFTPVVLSSMIQGEAKEAAKVLCAVAREVRRFGRPVKPPACLLCGGETTVTIKGNGSGGRNMELALAGALALAGEEKFCCCPRAQTARTAPQMPPGPLPMKTRCPGQRPWGCPQKSI
ncbi:glycerate 2-kinase Gck [Desulfotignum phosphitoxidans DSM 13687]|uniref:Glycerate 2-kinase Gck n=1 Tax=Desulfotignum phosphitoxidans DSM 13687 TaxID=1286635 RepID=S0FTS9_9BACT|nr:glycerate 2-kinase Gck [Desulfotignum phosphitoxidans DSM 13687]